MTKFILKTTSAALLMGGSFAYAQEVFNLPQALYFSGPGYFGNTRVTQLATSSYILSRDVTVLNQAQLLALNTSPHNAMIVFRNSAYPNRSLAVYPWGVAGGLTQIGMVQLSGGTLAEMPITAGSVWTIEFAHQSDFNPIANLDSGPIQLASNVSQLKRGRPDIVVQKTFEGSQTSTFTETGAGVSSPTVLGPRVVLKSGFIETDPLGDFSFGPITVTHTALPGHEMRFHILGHPNGPFEYDPSLISQGSGSLVGKEIPVEGHFEYHVQINGESEGTLNDLAIGLTSGNLNETYSTTEDITAVGPLGNDGNGIKSLGTVDVAFPMGRFMEARSRLAVLGPSSSITNARFRVVNSAYPTIFVDGGIFTVSGTPPAPYEMDVTADLSSENGLFGSIIPAGSEFTVEGFRLNSGSYTWKGFELAAEQTPLPFAGTLWHTWMDAGVISANSPLEYQFAGIRNSNPNWFSFEIPAGIPAGKFLDIWTGDGTPVNTMMGLYTSDGVLVKTDDDDGNGMFSAMSFGSGSGSPPASGVVSSDGRDGTLPPGRYFLSVNRWFTTYSQGFGVSYSTLTIRTPFKLYMRSNVDWDQVITIPVTGADAVFFGRSRTLTYTFEQAGMVVGSGTGEMYWTTTTNKFKAPVGITGNADLVIDGGPFLRRRVPVVLTGTNQTLPGITLTNGDVDHSGEVDAADVDAVISKFGLIADIDEDCNLDGEVDAADIDIVIASFGSVDE